MVVFSLTLIRHGETLANRENIIQGQSDIPLSDVGIQQAKLVGVRLQNERFTHVFASDLLRAAQTAQAIVEANKVNVSSVIKDKRLRERKFGVVEGKTFKDLAAEAKKHNSSVPNFTPKGAERIEQVRARARSFFRDLVSLLKNNAYEDGNYTPASIKRRADHGLNHSLNPVPCQPASTRNSNQTDSSNHDMTDKIHIMSKRPRHEELELKFVDKSELHLLDIEDETDKLGSNNDGVFEDGHSLDMPQTAIARSNSSSSSGCSSLPESSESQEHVSELSTPTEEEQKDFDPTQDVHLSSPVAADTEIKTNIRSSRSDAFGCPNVSLSPLLEHRLSSISSISSGRNSSFDDADGFPPSVADVIVVSHGGFLKELIRHFVEDLKCKMPGGKIYALRVGPNASVSKFTITIDDITDLPIITCLLIHDKEHLLPLDMYDAPGTM